MWKRKELKNRAKNVLKKNYWTAIVVCFLIALLTGEFGTSIMGILEPEDSMNPYYIITNPNTLLEDKNQQNENEFLKQQEKKAEQLEEKKQNYSDVELKIFDFIQTYIDSMTKSKKFLFKISDAIKSFFAEKDTLGIVLSIMAVLSVAFAIFIANPLIVALRKYFYKARSKSDTKINVVLEVFKKECWLNISVTMLLKEVFTLLWFFTIIGGVIKIYEYSMIPFILADKSKIKWKKVFKLSKQMMKGNKWKLFVLDLSFLGWEILSIFTFGLLNIFYVNPYKLATNVELYEILKKNAIKDEIEFFEELK